MKRDVERWELVFGGVVFLAGLALRLRLALLTYLNPDEALHALLAMGSWGDALRNSLTVPHPPLLIAVTHAVLLISRTEFALRLVPLLAGCLFPVLLFVWLRRVAGRMAAATALFLLTLAPHWIAVSAQLRSYTLALLWLSASLVVLELALERNRWPMMALYNVLLWLCILSDYSMAWFVGAAGVYGLLRLKGSSRALKATWAAGQLMSMALYGWLLTIQVKNLRGGRTEQGALADWLNGAFPRPGEMLAFPLVNTVKQFAYLMASVPMGILALVVFAVAVFWLWTGRTGLEQSKARALAVLLVVPFLLGIAGAYAHLFPYGRSRHTLVMGLFCACGIAIFLETLPRRWATAMLWGALLLTPLWQWKGDIDRNEIGADRNKKELILQCLNYMRAAIPPGDLVFAEQDTLEVLAYYEGHHALPERADRRFSEFLLGGRWRVVTRDYQFVTREAYEAGLAAFRRQYGLGESQPVWVLDGGWDVVSAPSDEKRPFTKAVRVFQAGSR